jgi:transposase
MIEGLIQGTKDPEVLADLAKGRLRKKLPLLQKALSGKFRKHHAFMATQVLSLIDGIEATLEDVSTQIEEMMRPFEETVIKLKEIPGLERKIIEDILAEITDNMSNFPTSRHIASWAAICPGNNESAGRRKSGKTRHGNKWLCTALVQAARAAVRKKDSYFAALYRRIVVRRGDQKAIIAVAHSLLVTIYHILRNRTDYSDLGADYFTKRNNEAAKRRSIKELERLGFKVLLEPVATALAVGA